VVQRTGLSHKRQVSLFVSLVSVELGTLDHDGETVPATSRTCAIRRSAPEASARFLDGRCDSEVALDWRNAFETHKRCSSVGRHTANMARTQCAHCAASLYNTSMAVAPNNYFVRLRPDLSPQEASEFRAFVKKTASGGPPSDTRLILACVRIDLLHHFFAKLTINVEDGVPPMDLWVPHQMILMIGDIRHVGRAPVMFTPTE
jgi:hypothetical protein